MLDFNSLSSRMKKKIKSEESEEKYDAYVISIEILITLVLLGFIVRYVI